MIADPRERFRENQVEAHDRPSDFRSCIVNGVTCISRSSEERFRSIKMRCLRSLLIIFTALFVSSRLIAQSPEIMPRIAGPVDETVDGCPDRQRTRGCAGGVDRGQAPASTQMTHVRLVLARSSQQEAALDTYLAELQDKSSPNYHKWLKPAEFGKLYGPADSDIAAIVHWLQSHGMQVDPVQPGRTNISFSGSVQQIQDLLQISIHSFDLRGEQFLPIPTIPASRRRLCRWFPVWPA